MQTRIQGLLEWLLHHWKAVKKQQNQKSMCDSELVRPASLRYLLSGSSQKKKFFCFRVHSKCAGRLLKHGCLPRAWLCFVRSQNEGLGMTAFSRLVLQVCAVAPSESWGSHRVLVASWDPFSGFLRPKLFCNNSAALLSSFPLSTPKLIRADCTKEVMEAPGGQPRQQHHAGPGVTLFSAVHSK